MTRITAALLVLSLSLLVMLTGCFESTRGSDDTNQVTKPNDHVPVSALEGSSNGGLSEDASRSSEQTEIPIFSTSGEFLGYLSDISRKVYDITESYVLFSLPTDNSIEAEIFKKLGVEKPTFSENYIAVHKEKGAVSFCESVSCSIQISDGFVSFTDKIKGSKLFDKNANLIFEHDESIVTMGNMRTYLSSDLALVKGPDGLNIFNSDGNNIFERHGYPYQSPTYIYEVSFSKNFIGLLTREFMIIMDKNGNVLREYDHSSVKKPDTFRHIVLQNNVSHIQVSDKFIAYRLRVRLTQEKYGSGSSLPCGQLRAELLNSSGETKFQDAVYYNDRSCHKPFGYPVENENSSLNAYASKNFGAYVDLDHVGHLLDKNENVIESGDTMRDCVFSVSTNLVAYYCNPDYKDNNIAVLGAGVAKPIYSTRHPALPSKLWARKSYANTNFAAISVRTNSWDWNDFTILAHNHDHAGVFRKYRILDHNFHSEFVLLTSDHIYTKSRLIRPRESKTPPIDIPEGVKKTSNNIESGDQFFSIKRIETKAGKLIAWYYWTPSGELISDDSGEEPRHSKGRDAYFAEGLVCKKGLDNCLRSYVPVDLN